MDNSFLVNHHEPRRCLLVVDVQNDFISGSLALIKCPAKQDGEDVVQIINKKIFGDPKFDKFFDIVVFTQDWHPINHCSFIENLSNLKFNPLAINKEDIKIYDSVQLIYPPLNKSYRQILWPKHCVQNTWGAELDKNLRIPIPSGNIKEVYKLYKGLDSDVDCYSAFWSTDWLVPTGLNEKLKGLKIDTLYICGLALDICVYHSAVDGKRLGYDVKLIRDACRGVSNEGMAEALEDMTRQGIAIIDSKQVYTNLQNDVPIYLVLIMGLTTQNQALHSKLHANKSFAYHVLLEQIYSEMRI